MAKEKRSKEGYVRAKGNRGEDFDEPRMNISYDYRPENQYTDKAQERSTRRFEVREQYRQMYDLEQRRDQRAFARLQDMNNEFFEGVDPRRREEIADGGMIREDHNSMANLPRQAIHCEYPQAPYYSSNYIDNAFRGTESQDDDNGDSMARYLNPYKSAKTPR